MYKDAKELLNKEIDFGLKKQIYYSIHNGTEVFKEVLGRSIDVFGADLSTNILPRVMTFCIDRQFSPDLYVAKNGFESNTRSVNVFNYKVVELANSNMLLHVAKTKNGILLPNKSKYKLEYSRNNDFGQEQLKLDLGDKHNTKVINSPYYGIIVYSIGRGYEVQSINLIVPNYNMEHYLEKIDIKEEIERLKTVENDRENEKTLVTLKDIVKNNKEEIINKKIN